MKIMQKMSAEHWAALGCSHTRLFPQNSPLLIPVTPECDEAIASQHPSTADECLMVADGSDLPATLGSLLRDPFSGQASSEATVSVVIGGAIRTILLRMSKFSCIDPKDLQVLFNETEKQRAPLARPCSCVPALTCL